MAKLSNYKSYTLPLSKFISFLFDFTPLLFNLLKNIIYLFICLISGIPPVKNVSVRSQVVIIVGLTVSLLCMMWRIKSVGSISRIGFKKLNVMHLRTSIDCLLVTKRTPLQRELSIIKQQRLKHSPLTTHPSSPLFSFVSLSSDHINRY